MNSFFVISLNYRFRPRRCNARRFAAHKSCRNISSIRKAKYLGVRSFCKNLGNYNKSLINVFNRLRQHKLKISPDVSKFLDKGTFLGHTVLSDVIETNRDKIKCILKFPVPKRIN